MLVNRTGPARKRLLPRGGQGSAGVSVAAGGVS